MSSDANKAVVGRYFHEFQGRRQTSIAGEIIAPDLVGPAMMSGQMIHTAFPDLAIAIEHQVAEGDMVATVWSARGTHQGEWASPIGPIPASGRPVAWTATTTLRLRDGRIVEVIGTNWDHLGILQQMGALPATAPRPGA